MASTLIWACWNNEAAAANEHIRRVKEIARCILEFLSKLISIFNLSSEERKFA